MIIARVVRATGDAVWVLGLSDDDVTRMRDTAQTIFVPAREDLPSLVVLCRPGDDADVARFVRTTVHDALGIARDT